ncbi:hypothetical protein OSTOST_13426, partial [Ostertagia ostertagi]
MLLPALMLLPMAVASLIPREVLFSDPKYSSVSLTPDENKVKNVFVKCIDSEHTRQVTFEKNRNVLGKIYMGFHSSFEIKNYNNVYSFDLLTDSMTLVMKDSRFDGVIVDNDPNIRLVVEEQQDGPLMYF